MDYIKQSILICYREFDIIISADNLIVNVFL